MSGGQHKCRTAPSASALLARYLDHLLGAGGEAQAPVPDAPPVPPAVPKGAAAAEPARRPAAATPPSRSPARPRRDGSATPVAPVAVATEAAMPPALLPPALSLAALAPAPAPQTSGAPRAPAAASRPEAAAAVSSPVQAAPPEWAAAPFQALLFRVGELALAAPLTRLYGVLPWSDQIARLPNSPEWSLGLMPYREQHVRVVDTARLLSGGRRIDAAAPPRHVILLDEGRWGMTCDGLNDVLALAPEQVKWRGAGGKRLWLAGILRERLCALLDVDALTGMLARG